MGNPTDDAVAGPPSPENLAVPAPAIVVMIFVVADPMVVRVRDVDIARRVDRDAGGIADSRRSCQSAISSEPAAPGHGRDDLRHGVNLEDPKVLPGRDVEVPSGVERHWLPASAMNREGERIIVGRR